MHDLWNQTSHTSQHMACCPKSTLDWQQPHGKIDLYDGLGPGLICMSPHKRSERKPKEVKEHDPEFSILQREKHLFCKRTCEHSARLGVFWIMSITSQVIAWVGGKAWLWSRQGTTVRAVNLASSQRVRRNVCVFMAEGWLFGCGSKGKTGHTAEGWRFMPSWWHWQHKRTLTRTVPEQIRTHVLLKRKRGFRLAVAPYWKFVTRVLRWIYDGKVQESGAPQYPWTISESRMYHKQYGQFAGRREFAISCKSSKLREPPQAASCPVRMRTPPSNAENVSIWWRHHPFMCWIVSSDVFYVYIIYA